MRRVILESPFKGDDWKQTERNIAYLRLCLRDCVLRGEAPYASHALFTQPGVLDDHNPDERTLGMNAGFAWREVAEKTVVYTDFGISRGMQYGITHAETSGMPVEYRKIFDDVPDTKRARLLAIAIAPFPEQKT